MDDAAQAPVRYPWHYFGITLLSCIVLGFFLPRVFWNVLWLGSTIWVYLDARSRGIPRAGAWALNMLILWIAAFPFYIYRRNWPERPCPSVEGRSPWWVVVLLLLVAIVLAIIAFNAWKPLMTSRSKVPQTTSAASTTSPQRTIAETPTPETPNPEQPEPSPPTYDINDLITHIRSVTPSTIQLLGIEDKRNEIFIDVFIDGEDWDGIKARLEDYRVTLNGLPELGVPDLDSVQSETRADVQGRRFVIAAPVGSEFPIRPPSAPSSPRPSEPITPSRPFQASITVVDAITLLAEEATSASVKIDTITRTGSLIGAAGRIPQVAIEVTLASGHENVGELVERFEQRTEKACLVRGQPADAGQGWKIIFDCAVTSSAP